MQAVAVSDLAGTRCFLIARRIRATVADNRDLASVFLTIRDPELRWLIDKLPRRLSDGRTSIGVVPAAYIRLCAHVETERYHRANVVCDNMSNIV